MSQQYGYPYPSSGGEGYPGIPLGVPAHETSQYNQGYYGAQSAAAPPPTGTADYGQQLIPGFPAPRNEPPPQFAGYPPRGSFPNDPYAGYDAVQYPSIPALVEHAAREGSVGTAVEATVMLRTVLPTQARRTLNNRMVKTTVRRSPRNPARHPATPGTESCFFPQETGGISKTWCVK